MEHGITTRQRRSRRRRGGRRRPVGRSAALRLAAQVSLIGVLLVAPWVMGGVRFQTQVYLYAALLMCQGLWLASYVTSPIDDRDRTRLPTLIIPLVLGVIGGTLQLIPASFPQALGPQAGFEVPARETYGIVRTTASVYPLATRTYLAKLSFAVLAFFLAARLFDSRKSQVWLFAALAVGGLALGFFGIAQKLNWNGHLFWIGPEVINGKPFASYVNRNNAAGYLNLTLAAAVGFLLWTTYRESTDGGFQYDMLRDGMPRGFSERIQGWLWHAGRVSTVQLFAGVCVVFIAAAVIASASRGGILSAAFAAVVVFAAMVIRGVRKSAVLLTGSAVAIGMALIVWLGLFSSVGERFAAIGSETTQKGRYQNWVDVCRSLPEIWTTGSGMGTYAWFHRPYETHQGEGWYVHAENQYIETLVETGAFGLALLVAAIVLGTLAAVRLVRSRLIGRADGVAFVGLFALASQGAHAFLDFGLLLSANMLTFAVLMGAVCGRAVRKREFAKGGWYIALPPLRPRIALALFGVILLVNGALGWTEIVRAADADQAGRLARHLDATATDDDYQRVLTELLASAERRPDDADLQYDIAEIYLRMYRTATRRKITAEARGVTFTPDELESLSSVKTLYAQANRLSKAGMGSQLKALREDPIVRDTLVPARSALLTARAACPLNPRVELALASLAPVAEDGVDGFKYLQRCVWLAPYESFYLYEAGTLALEAGRTNFAIDVWRRAYRVSHQYRRPILKRLARDYPPSWMADEFLPGDVGLLSDLAADRVLAGEQPELVEAVFQRLEGLTGDRAAPGRVQNEDFVRGLIAEHQGQDEAACDWFEKAVARGEEAERARMHWIECLIHLERLDDAEMQLRTARGLGISPNEVRRLEKIVADARKRSEK